MRNTSISLQKTPPPEAVDPTKVRREIANIKRYITKLLKEEGSYQPRLGYQIESVASDIIIYRRLRDQLLTKTDFMVVEKSREGYDRSKVTSLVMEVRLQSERVQKGLDLLLMNVKSKKGKGQGKDALSEFMEAMKDGED
jgi:hypothetical protein